ncbi:hypothetical protein D3C87_1444510 [compost metagenome]
MFGSFIDPDTSIRKTRLEAGRLSVAIFLPCMPICTSLWFVFHGAVEISVIMFTGAVPLGCGYS